MYLLLRQTDGVSDNRAVKTAHAHGAVTGGVGIGICVLRDLLSRCKISSTHGDQGNKSAGGVPTSSGDEFKGGWGAPLINPLTVWITSSVFGGTAGKVQPGLVGPHVCW